MKRSGNKPIEVTIPPGVQEWIDSQAPDMAKHATKVVTDFLRRRQQLINTITAHESNVFTLDQLNAMGVDVLEGVAALAEQNADHDVPWFAGLPRFGGLPNGTNSDP